jgi:hypothetical protein
VWLVENPGRLLFPSLFFTLEESKKCFVLRGNPNAGNTASRSVFKADAIGFEKRKNKRGFEQEDCFQKK